MRALLATWLLACRHDASPPPAPAPAPAPPLGLRFATCGPTSATFVAGDDQGFIDDGRLALGPVEATAYAGLLAGPHEPLPPVERTVLAEPYTRPESRPRSQAHSPLRERAAALEACIRPLGGQDHGSFTIDLPDGHVDGVNDATFAACVANAVHGVAKDPLRCGIAFGTLTGDTVPSVRIRSGELLARFDALGPDHPQYPPTLIEPDDATPMKLVFRVMAAAYFANHDFVLAQARGAGWELLRDAELPDPPVAPGGARPRSGYRAGWTEGTDATVDASGNYAVALVSPSMVWIAQVRVAGGKQFPLMDRDAIESWLAYLKSDAFPERTDIFIGATDDARYGGVAEVISAARRAGFVDWQLTTERGLRFDPRR